MPPSIIDLKVYTPAKDFELSKRFYAALGFDLTDASAGDVDCRLGGAAFRLQTYYNKDWAENFMMFFGVDDARDWYAHAKVVLDKETLETHASPNPKRSAARPFATFGIRREFRI